MVLRMPGPLAVAGNAASKPAALWTGAAPAKALQTAHFDVQKNSQHRSYCLVPGHNNGHSNGQPRQTLQPGSVAQMLQPSAGARHMPEGLTRRAGQSLAALKTWHEPKGAAWSPAPTEKQPGT